MTKKTAAKPSGTTTPSTTKPWARPKARYAQVETELTELEQEVHEITEVVHGLVYRWADAPSREHDARLRAACVRLRAAHAWHRVVSIMFDDWETMEPEAGRAPLTPDGTGRTAWNDATWSRICVANEMMEHAAACLWFGRDDD